VKALLPLATVVTVSFSPLNNILQPVLGLRRAVSIGVVSESEILLGFARAVVTAYSSDGATCATARLGDRRAVKALLASADLVMADTFALPAVLKQRREHVVEFRLLARSSLAKLGVLFQAKVTDPFQAPGESPARVRKRLILGEIESGSLEFHKRCRLRVGATADHDCVVLAARSPKRCRETLRHGHEDGEGSDHPRRSSAFR